MSFTELNLAPEIARAVEEEGYEAPTPIQQEAIPGILAGRDLIGCAQTGTGKTAAFTLPILHRLRAGARGRVRALILTPTRELALQVAESLRVYGRHLRLESTFRGGSSRVMVATDIAGRGIDVDGIAHVVNFDLPNVPEDYVHRIGRTARAGATGEAISLVSPEDHPHVRGIETLIGHAIERQVMQEFAAGPAVSAAPVARPDRVRCRVPCQRRWISRRPA